MAANADEKYGGLAMTLHWLTFALILANIALGLSMVPLPLSPTKLKWYLAHKTIGVTVFLVTGARLAWRFAHGAPPAVAMPEWQRRAATAVHRALYALLFLIPISGWIYSSSTGVQVVYLGVVELPDLVAKDRELAAVLKAIHVGLNLLLAALVLVHAGASFKHHFVERDGVLARMLPFARSRSNAG